MQYESTVPEKILTAAIELDAEVGTFTAEQLVVRCWLLFPQTFGLQGYADKYPDSNRVLTNIMGRKGLRGKGWLRKVGEKRYRVTEAGKRAITQRSVGATSKADCRAALSRSTVSILRRLLDSRALQKFRLHEQLTFGDLSSFWNISPRSNAYQLNVAIRDTEATLETAADFLGSEGLESLLLPGSSMQISKGDLRLMTTLHEHLKTEFTTELDVIRKRADERLPR